MVITAVGQFPLGLSGEKTVIKTFPTLNLASLLVNHDTLHCQWHQGAEKNGR